MVDRSKKSCTLEVNPAPYAPPGENEIVVKSGAVAINPVDWLKQDMGDMMFSWIKYPFVLASDVAGEVVQIGRPVSRFKVGDRVVGHAVGISQKQNSSGIHRSSGPYGIADQHLIV
ncbi:chaperonin 10-like protein [Lipomyces tetrasporus]